MHQKDAVTIVIEEEDPETADDENTAAENAAPMAVADASPTGGQVPLEVTFTGSNSTDDQWGRNL